jgi:hypothetical protein
MNRAQEVFSDLLGIREVYESEMGELREVQEHLIADNAMLQREIEDLDYLNLYDLANVKDIIPVGDRRRHLMRLRRLRHEHPLAKQAIKLILRFTLGRGVQYVVSPKIDPAKLVSTSAGPEEAPLDQQPTRGGILPIKFVDPTKPASAPGSPAPKNVVPFRKKVSADLAGDTLQEPDNDPIRDIVEEFWNDDDNKLILTSRAAERDALDDVATDGEKFFLGFEDPAAPYLKLSFLPVEEITHIVYDPDNRARPVYYQRTYIEQKFDGKNDQYVPDSEPIKKYYLDYRVTDEDLTRIGSSIVIPVEQEGSAGAARLPPVRQPRLGEGGKTRGF